ncbi:MAG TPA: diacylglycerol kinase [Planctomycetaceae bacterium]|nr:diacylglycerol kinase [Planctomycetaceae bacterium]
MLSVHAPHAHSEPDDLQAERRRRPAWRQRLIQAERGFGTGLRIDSTFFVHFFTSSMVLAAAAVIGLGILQWAILALSITLVLAAEMFNQVLKLVLAQPRLIAPAAAQKALGISTAAVYVTIAGCVVTILLLFGQRLDELF